MILPGILKLTNKMKTGDWNQKELFRSHMIVYLNFWIEKHLTFMLWIIGINILNFPSLQMILIEEELEYGIINLAFKMFSYITRLVPFAS